MTAEPVMEPALGPDPVVMRAVAGDREAFGELYRRCYDDIFRFVYYRTGNRAMAEDLTADTFVRALKNIGSFVWQGRSINAWLVTIARNLIADHFKSHQYRREVTSSPLAEGLARETTADESPEDEITEQHTAAELWNAVDRLTPEQRDVVRLRFAGQRSVEETARTLGVTVGTVKARQYRATHVLAKGCGGLR